jgi:hypothetical protein
MFKAGRVNVHRSSFSVPHEGIRGIAVEPPLASVRCRHVDTASGSVSAGRRSLGAKSQDANAVNVLAKLRVDKNVLPCLVDEGVCILHDPCRLTVIAQQDCALWQPFGVPAAGAAAEALRDTRFFPSLM